MWNYSFRLETDAQDEWLLIKSPPAPKEKRSKDLDDILRTIAQPTTTTISPVKAQFTFQFGNKRGRPIPPRPQVISAVKVKPSPPLNPF